MINRQSSHIKRAQKESLLLRELSKLLLASSLDDPRLSGIFINRVQLSRDKSVCTILFYTQGGQEVFEEKLPTLILYKPSMRKALADSIQSRYVPELVFTFDAQFQKQQHIEALIDSIGSK